MLNRFVGLSLTGSLLLATMLYSAPSVAGGLTADMIYSYAEKGQIKQLLNYKHNGYSLDVVDDDGNTALCQAALNGNKTVVKRLLGLGVQQWPACMQRIPRDKLQKVDLIGSRQLYTRNSVPVNNKPSMPSPAVWKTNTFLTLAGIGGVAGIVALAGGGGGGSSDGEDESTNFEEVTYIPADQSTLCSGTGYKVINGVCTKVVTDEAKEGKEVSVINRTESPYNLSELGGQIENSAELSYTGSNSERIIAMQANGVSSSAYDADESTIKVTDSKVSTATNYGVINLTESSALNQGVVGLYATSAASVYNDGDITVTSLSENDSAAILVEKHGSSATPETGDKLIDGANVTNEGHITIIDNGKGKQSVAGIDAKGRNVTNNGIIDIIIGKTSEPVIMDNHPHGEANGIYSKNVVNKGTINLKSDKDSTAPNLVDTDVFMIRGTSNEETTVANDGTLNIDLTDIAYGIKAIWSDPTTATTVKNTGTINVTGKLYNLATIDKQVYLMGINGSSESGEPTIRNVGNINVGTTEKPIDISMGGLFYAMYAPYGNMSNTQTISFNIHADPTTALGNAFRSYVLHLGDGTLTNDGDILYSFDNLDAAGKVQPTSEQIELTAIDTEDADVTNNAAISATLKGSSALGSNFYGILGTSSDAEITNNGPITVDSTVDNMSLTGVKTTSGDSINTSNSEINLRTTGENSNLYGLMGLGKGNNSGTIVLTHDGGSTYVTTDPVTKKKKGSLQGVAGQNDGYVQINANNMTGETSIYGVGINGGGSNSTESKIDIYMRGTTYGQAIGTNIAGDAASSPVNTSNGEINIYATDRTRAGNLLMIGIKSETTERNLVDVELQTLNQKTLENDTYEIYEDGDVTAVNAGRINLNVGAADDPLDSTLAYGMYGLNANVTNTGVININADTWDSVNYQIAGMVTKDTVTPIKQQDPLTFIARNKGTININVKADNSSVAYDFGVAGMLTDSIAINEGNIVLNVMGDSKTVGMAATDGGIIINAGTITYTGTAENFTPMYASGSKVRTTVEDELKSYVNGGKYVQRTTTETTYYGTVYNYGKIIITDPDASVKTPEGDGYYKSTDKNMYLDLESNPQVERAVSTVIDTDDVALVWARKAKDGIQECDPDTGSCEPTSPTLKLNADKTTINITEDGVTVTGRGFTKFPTTLLLAAPKMTTSATPKMTSAKTMQINDGMEYVSEIGGVFSAEGYHLSGDVVAGQSLVQGINADYYVVEGDGEGAIIGDGDATDLKLSSDSVMFNASYVQNMTNDNGLDILMERKSFNELVENDSLAGFLEDNYKKGNNVSLFDKFKSFSALNELTDTVSKMTSNDVFSKFNFEDMTVMRELNYSLNQQLFHNNENSFAVAGEMMPLGFQGDSVSKSKYSLYNKRTGDTSIGLGIAFSDIRSGDSHNDSSDRREMMYQMAMPIGFKAMGLNWIASPRIGYARANYDRTGSDNQNFNGTYEKQMYGLMNEARYPIKVSDWVFEPGIEFNAIGYKQKGHEDQKDYSLNIVSQNTLSVETGIGFNLTKNKEFNKNERLNLNLGASLYHEFADPYQTDIGMNGMDGTFTLRDEDRTDNRAVVRMGLDYNTKHYSLYGSFLSYIDGEVRSSVKSGFKVKF